MAQDNFRRMLSAGEILFDAGDPGSCAYVVESGRLEIFIKDEDDNKKVLGIVGPSQICGEMALIDDQPRSATAMALEPTTLIIFPRDHLTERLGATDPMLRHILRVVISRARDAMHMARGIVASGADLAATGEDDGDTDRDVALKRLDLEQALQLAVQRKEFVLYFQPIMWLADDSIAGFEALIRWNRPGQGRVSPAEFIPVAEQSDLIHDIGRWLIHSAFEQLANFETIRRSVNPDHLPLFMSVNLSGRQFYDPELVPALTSALNASGVPPQQVKLEITETLLMNNFELANNLLARCKALGLKVALDDFGTGYSSLAYLHRFPVDTIKLDRAFVKEVVDSIATQKIVHAVASLALELGMDTVAEGIESPQQADILREIGVVYAQGHCYGTPLSAEDASLFVRRNAVPRRSARSP